ncbi:MULTISPECIES: alpha/beta fold hydrolase [unclassified Saccharothrix]|uniref:alpha/beta fold hydrolase n=1 Tax=unclassified Saccharothrix TaxID=2593673 RepID=UPI00307EE937
MAAELTVTLDGRTLRAHDTGTTGFPVFWHHGTPNTGAPPEPLFADAARLGLRWVSYDRPGYGGSTRVPGRDLASAARDVQAVADALGLDRFAVVGHSGGAPHALACAVLLPHRVSAVVASAGMAPFGAAGLDWFAGMAASGVESLRAAAAGRAEKEAYEASGVEYDPEFTEADVEALNGDWSWFGQVVGPALADGPGGLVDDDLAYVSPWGFDPATLTVPALFLHGNRDRVVPAAHSTWMSGQCRAELRLFPDDGHISVLRHMPSALDWLARFR